MAWPRLRSVVAARSLGAKFAFMASLVIAALAGFHLWHESSTARRRVQRELAEQAMLALQFDLFTIQEMGADLDIVRPAHLGADTGHAETTFPAVLHRVTQGSDARIDQTIQNINK